MEQPNVVCSQVKKEKMKYIFYLQSTGVISKAIPPSKEGKGSLGLLFWKITLKPEIILEVGMCLSMLILRS